MKTIQTFSRVGVALALVLTLASCRTIQYREVQSDFNRAVDADNARAESPFVDWYQGVTDTLTDDYIAKLDEKLRPNAWMLRGFSEWRSGSYSNANISAAKGWQEIERQKATTPNLVSSRDGIVLSMLPGLVQDSQLRARLQATGANLTVDGYQTNFLPQFKAVFTQFREAKQNFAAPTPPAVKVYWNFQTWRVLQNWRITLGKLPAGEDATKQAYTHAHTFVINSFPALTGSTNLASSIQVVKAAIPADHAYRGLIEIEQQFSF